MSSLCRTIRRKRLGKGVKAAARKAGKRRDRKAK